MDFRYCVYKFEVFFFCNYVDVNYVCIFMEVVEGFFDGFFNVECGGIDYFSENFCGKVFFCWKVVDEGVLGFF